MTYNATFFRKKREYIPPLVIFTALYFDTDKKVDPKKETTLFLNKVYEKGNKLQSFNRS